MDGLIVDSGMIMPPKDGITQTVVRNDSKFTQNLDGGAVLGLVESAKVLDVYPYVETSDSVTVNRHDSAKPEVEEGEAPCHTEIAYALTRRTPAAEGLPH